MPNDRDPIEGWLDLALLTLVVATLGAVLASIILQTAGCSTLGG